MASETQIKMNFQNALRRAQEIEDIGNKLLSLAQDETNQCLLELGAVMHMMQCASRQTACRTKR